MPTNQFFRGTVLAWMILLLTGTLVTVSAQEGKNFLEIPVKLEVEKGDLNDVVIKVRKDGKDAFTQSGASKMRFKLDFSRKYTLIFTKPGYITKTIEVNTNAPSARIAHGFEPYKIGVKLFKQSDDEHKVVYNQPVARIKFDENLDEFNFDTDYSKSILSALQGKKDKNPDDLQTGVTADPSPETPAVASSGTEASPAGGSTFTASTESAPVASAMITGNDQAPASPAAHTTSTKSAEPAPETASPAPASPMAREEVPAQASVIAGEEKTADHAPISGQEEASSTSGSGGDDQHRSATTVEGIEQPSNAITPTSGADTNPVSQIVSSGSDTPTPDGFIPESEHITREDIVEKNRVIVLVKITQGAKVTQYSRVQYNWGGRYFFKDNATSISETAFSHQTGIRP